MTREAKNKSFIGISEKSKRDSRTITFPIRAQCVTFHGRPAVMLPKPIAILGGFDRNWDNIAFDISLVENGILLTIKNRYADLESRESEAGAAFMLATPRPNVELLPSSKRALAISFAGEGLR